MDYPKSVPNVGLVSGKFADENPATGVVGSLIPSVWGNSVTDEVIAVIQDSGLVPDEFKFNQLSAAIKRLVASGVDIKTQDSRYDGTPGKLVTTGGFGWGSDYVTGPMLLTDMLGQQVTFSGLYRYSSVTVGKPEFGSGYGSVHHSSITSDSGGNYATQLVIDYASDAIGFRRLTGASGWQAFREIWHTGNLGVATESVAGIQKIATQTLVNDGVDDKTAITPKKLAGWFVAKFVQTSESVAGLLKIATNVQVANGVDDSAAVTPLKLANKGQANPYDSSTGKLLSVGAFGLGSTYANGPLLLTNASGTQPTGSGLYRYSSATTDKPGFGSGFGIIHHSSITSDGGGNYATQFAVDYSANSLGFRRLSGSLGWQPWLEIWHSGNLVQSTTASKGISRLSTQAEVNSGSDDTSIVTPTKLRLGFASSFTTNGYIVFPSWLGGFIIQWGSVSLAQNATGIATPVISYPNAILFATAVGTSNSIQPTTNVQTAINVIARSTTSITLANDDVAQFAYWASFGN